MSATDLLKYGNWSGPGWTAGLPADFFASQGLARRITAADRAVDGIDHYDNFVAKAHDLNEFRAEARLRDVLGGLGLSDNATQVLPDGREAWSHPLTLGLGGADIKRFVSFDQYLARLLSGGPSQAEIETLCRGFICYFAHVSQSNTQFAIDQVLNHVDYVANIAKGAFRMGYQLRIAPHWFLKEAVNVELKCLRIELAHGVNVLGTQHLADYLNDAFIAPNEAFFDPVDGDGPVDVLTRSAKLAATRDELDDVLPALLAPTAHHSRDQIARMVRAAKPAGFESVGSLMNFLAAI